MLGLIKYVTHFESYILQTVCLDLRVNATGANIIMVGVDLLTTEFTIEPFLNWPVPYCYSSNRLNNMLMPNSLTSYNINCHA